MRDGRILTLFSQVAGNLSECPGQTYVYSQLLTRIAGTGAMRNILMHPRRMSPVSIG